MEFCISPVIKGNEADAATVTEKLLNITAQYAARTMAFQIFIDLFVNLKSFMFLDACFPQGRGAKEAMLPYINDYKATSCHLTK